MSKNDFYETFTTCKAQTGLKIKNAQNLLKFGTLEILNMPITILMWNWFLLNINHLLDQKSAPKLKEHRIYWNAWPVFKLYKLSCLIFLRTCLIKTHGFALTNGWMVKTTTTLCANPALQQRQLLQFFISN